MYITELQHNNNQKLLQIIKQSIKVFKCI